MSENGVDITSPVGRIIWGHPTKARGKVSQDAATKGQPIMKDGVQVQQWSFGLAIPKDQFAATLWPAMAAEAATGYPHGVPNRFSWKYKDGDTDVDKNGKPLRDREGYAGCYVLAVTTEFQAPPVFKLVNGAYQQLDANAIKCGDYVAVGLNFKVNVATGTNTPSLYVNPRGIELVGYGTEIVGENSVDPNAVFGGVQRALPPGASATPMQQPGAPGMPGMMPAAAPMAQPGAMPGMPGQMPGAAPMAAPMVAPMQAAPPPVAAPVGPQRPTDPTHIYMPGTPQEQWWINGAWMPAPMQQPLPPPAHDFVNTAVGQPMQPAPMAMPQPQQPMMPGAMPGMPGPR